jgi:hypothetical protein
MIESIDGWSPADFAPFFLLVSFPRGRMRVSDWLSCLFKACCLWLICLWVLDPCFYYTAEFLFLLLVSLLWIWIVLLELLSKNKSLALDYCTAQDFLSMDKGLNRSISCFGSFLLFGCCESCNFLFDYEFRWCCCDTNE